MNSPFAHNRRSSAKIPRLSKTKVPRLSKTKIPRFQPGVVQTAPAGDCPRCHAQLTDPEGLGYCPGCGYCSAMELENGRRAAAAQPMRAAAASHVATFWEKVRQLPESVWPILIAALFLLPVCYFANRALAPNGQARFVWTWAQCGLGAAAIFVAQIWAYILLRRRKDEVGFLDIFLPGNLWRHAVHALPETGGAFSLYGFAGVAILTAVFWIGRWGWLLSFDTTPDVPTVHVADENPNFRLDYKKLKEVAANAERDKPAPPPPPPVDTRQTTQCVVIGYVPGENGRIDSLVVATLRDGTLTYAGTVSSGVGKSESAALTKKLASLTTKTPLLGGLDMKAVWVRPEVFCEVYQSGASSTGLLLEARFKAVIEE